VQGGNRRLDRVQGAIRARLASGVSTRRSSYVVPPRPDSRRFLVLVLVSGNTFAQSGESYHSFLTDTFQVSAGVFYPTKGLKLSADGTIPGDEIDFDDSLAVDDSEATGSLTFRWNFGEKWSLAGQYWKTDVSGSESLERDITWEDNVYRAGATVGAGFELSVTRLFLGRKFSTGPQYEFGAGIGAHVMSIDAFIEGEAFVDDESTGFRRSAVDASAPLPNIGAWYMYSPSRNWLLSARVDWLSASVGDYDGTLWNTSFGVNYAFTDHFGASLAYQFFSLDVDVDDSDWSGGAKISYSGPFLALTATW